MATEYILRRTDGKPLGSFEDVQTQIVRLFPGAEFDWTESGREKVQRAEANGVELPDEIRLWMESIPSLVEGVWESERSMVRFGLGYLEPVEGICCEPYGPLEELDPLLAALEVELGGTLAVGGTVPLPPGLASPPGAPPPPLYKWPGESDGPTG